MTLDVGAALLTANLLSALPDARAAEVCEDILLRPGLRVERIVSQGQVTLIDRPYVEAVDEWVLILRGAARLWLEGRDAEVVLNPGDHCLIPAGTAHRVTFTSPDEPTVWLAIHSDPA